MEINRVAVTKLPQDVPLFLRLAGEEITYLGPEPDRWRNNLELPLKNSQAPDHFLNMEMLQGMGPLPADRFEFIKMIEARRLQYEKANVKPLGGEELTPENVGFQPYIVMEVYGRLKAAMREYRHELRDKKPTAPTEAAVIFYAGWLGHYVADGSQPLHTTVNHNGWKLPENPHGFTTSDKLHGQFEGVFVKDNLPQLKFDDLVQPATKLNDVFADYQKYLSDSNALVVPLYELEKTGAFRDKGTPEGIDFVKKRLAAGAQMLTNIWYTAWVESAVEPPPHATEEKPATPTTISPPKN